MSQPATIHSIVRNEDQWVWFALKPWQEFNLPILVVDDNSTDQTGKVLRSLKLRFTSNTAKLPVTEIRNQMIAQTKTEWLILLDGDEVWNRGMIEKFLKHLKTVPQKVSGVFLQTRNCVGDVWHYLPQTFGKYQLGAMTGNFNIRAYRKNAGMKWFGTYPLEHYGSKDMSINTQSDKLSFFDGYYWHMTNLSRSSKADKIPGFRHRAVEQGIAADKTELPEVFWESRPGFVPDPLARRSISFELAAKIITPLKKLKRLL